MFKAPLLNKHTPFWIFSISVIIGMTLPVLIQDGMFMDAMLYTSVSHNLSMGYGTFWFPQFSKVNMAGLTSFHEQPPLVFGIQAVFFKLFGDSMYIERLYTLLTTCITALLIVLLWKETFKNNEQLKRFGWLPLILWITIPVCFWSYSNNMHENTMGIFTLSSVLLVFKALSSKQFKTVAVIAAGICIFLATFSKGIPGFFPIATPLLYWAITREIKLPRAILYTIIITLIPVIIYAILFCIPESSESLSIYLFKRALQRISDAPTVGNRFYILYRLFTELLPQLLFTGIVLLIAKLKGVKAVLSQHFKMSLFFIAVGLSASAPLLLTLVQKGFYFVPSLPFFAAGFSILIAPVLVNTIEKLDTRSRKYRILLACSIVLLISASAYTLSQKGKASREKEKLHDIYMIGKVVPKFSDISVPDKMWDDWSLQCYMMRYFNISIIPNRYEELHITEKTMKLDSTLNYQKVNLNTQKYDLYKKQ